MADKSAISRRNLLFGAVRGMKAEDEKKDASVPALARELEQGNEAYENGDYEKAIQHLRPYVKENTGDADTRSLLAYCLYKTGHYVQARVDFERVIRDKDGDKFASLFLGLCMVRTGKGEKAAKAWLKYVNPDDDPIVEELILQIAALKSGYEVDGEAMALALEEEIQARRQDLSSEA